MKQYRTVNLRVRARPSKFAEARNIASARRFVRNWAVRVNRREHTAWVYAEATPWLLGGEHPKPNTSCYHWFKRFTELRRRTPWLMELPCAPVREVLRGFAQAWTDHFNIPGRGKPRFHGRDHKLSIDFPGNSARLVGKHLRLRGIGWVRVSGSNRYRDGVVKTVHLHSDDGWRWYATIGYEVELPDVVDDGLVVGVDCNVGQIATSTGDILRMPDTRVLDARGRRYQRRMSRQVKGSNRYLKTRGRAAKAQRKRTNINRDWRHKTTRMLADSAGLVVFEKLNIRGMTRSAKGTVENPGKNVRQKAGLNRGILETGWGELHRMTEYKAAGTEVVNPAHTSQTCHRCGVVDGKSRKSQSVYECGHCGWRGNADHNAALNILARGKGASGRGWAFTLVTRTNRQPNCLAMRHAA